MTPVTERHSRLEIVDALRGLGALWVCIYHAREILWIGLSAATAHRTSNFDLSWWLSLATYPASLGSAGVTLFFVLSGYCIHRPQARRARSAVEQLDIRRYLLRRCWRIYPVLLPALVFTAVLDHYSRSVVPDDLKLGRHGWSTFAVNALNLQGIADTFYGSNGPLWSLSVEFHIYFAYILLFYAARRLSPIIALYSTLVASLVSQTIITTWFPTVTIFVPYLFTWTAGMFVADVEAGRAAWPKVSPRVVSALAIPTGLVLLALKYSFASQLVLGAGFASYVYVAVVAAQRGPESRSLVRAGLARVGVFSFSLYAIHEPLLVFVRAYALDGRNSAHVLVPFVGVAACGFAAWLFFLAFERWSLKLPGWLEPAALGHTVGSEPG